MGRGAATGEERLLVPFCASPCCCNFLAALLLVSSATCVSASLDFGDDEEETGIAAIASVVVSSWDACVEVFCCFARVHFCSASTCRVEAEAEDEEEEE